jgi:hypothetical protein
MLDAISARAKRITDRKLASNFEIGQRNKAASKASKSSLGHVRQVGVNSLMA